MIIIFLFLFLAKVTVQLRRRVGRHFVMLIEITVHLTECNYLGLIMIFKAKKSSQLLSIKRKEKTGETATFLA